MSKKVVETGLTIYDCNKQLMDNERVLSPFEIVTKSNEVKDFITKHDIRYAMLLCRERADYTLFSFNNFLNEKSKENFKSDFRTCLLNRGDVLIVREKEDHSAIEIWIRDKVTKENFCYYFFDYSTAVLEYY